MVTARIVTVGITFFLATLALSPLVPTAAASHCGAGIVPWSVSPVASANGGTLTVEARFLDTPETCGLYTWWMQINGVSVPASAYSTGTEYVVTYTATFAPGTYAVSAGVEEPCCSTVGSDSGQVAWSFVVAGVPTGVEFSLTPTTELTRVVVRDAGFVPGATHRVAGHVDLYRFTLPAGVIVTLPCVTLAADGLGANPCGIAGGAFVSRVATLVDQTASEPVPQLSPIASVGVCNAVLTLTVLGVGVNSAPALTLC